LAALACALCVAGCGTGAKGAHNRQHSAPELQIGEGTTLRGPRSGEELHVTLLSFAAELGGTINDHPEFDYQYAAVHLRLQNLGSLTYEGFPARQLAITSTESQTSKSTELSEGSCADAFARSVKLAPGASAEGCVPTQILVVSTPASLNFTPFSGSSSALRWSLQRRHHKG
jgi:hypothetical protein